VSLRRFVGTVAAGATFATLVTGCGGSAGTGKASGPFPKGTFKTTITREDLRGTPFPDSDAHVELLTFANGTWRDVWLPRRADQPIAGGRLLVRGNEVTFVGPGDRLTWSYYRGNLTFRIVGVADTFARFTYTVHPWHKIR
jgi:hypothetical protein